MVERAAAMLRAAGEAGRLRLLERLLAGERTVTHLAAGDKLPAVSQRLKLLRQAGLVRCRRAGKYSFYALADREIACWVRATLRCAGR